MFLCVSKLACMVCMLALVFIVGCGSNGAKKPHGPACIFKTDTLTAERSRTLCGDSALADSNALAVLARLVVLSDAYQGTLGNVEPRALAEQLSLRGGVGYSQAGATLLLRAALYVSMLPRVGTSIFSVCQGADSVVRRGVSCARLGVATLSTDSMVLLDGQKKLRREAIELVYCKLFSLSSSRAGVVYEFVCAVLYPSAKAFDSKALVKGLMYSAQNPSLSTSKARASSSTVSVAQTTSTDVLKLRPLQSITDTINRHITNIKAVYKKELKRSENLVGVVWVNFAVVEDGVVESVSVKKTSIADEKFLKELLNYLQTIKFLPVEASAGVMHFDFPFEFAPE